MNKFKLHRSLFAGISFITVLLSTQSYAGEYPFYSQSTSHIPAGSCENTNRVNEYNPSKFPADGTLSGRVSTRVDVICDLGTKPNYSSYWGGLRSVTVFISQYSGTDNYGKQYCKIVFRGRYGEFRGQVSKYSGIGRSSITIERPAWATNFNNASLVCRLTQHDKLFGFTTVSDHRKP